MTDIEHSPKPPAAPAAQGNEWDEPHTSTMFPEPIPSADPEAPVPIAMEYDPDAPAFEPNSGSNKAKPADALQPEPDAEDPDLVARFDIPGSALESVATTVFCHDETAKAAFSRFALCLLVHKDGSIGFGHSDTALKHAGLVRGEAYEDAHAHMTKAD